MTTKTASASLEDAEVDVVEPLVDVDQGVVVQLRQLLGDERQVLRADQLGGLGRRRREQQVDPRIVLDHDLLDEIDVDRRRRDDVHDALAIEPEVEEDAVVAELEVAVDQGDLAPELAVERDGRVDRDGRRPDAALGAVEREDPPERRPCEERFPWREARQEALDPGKQLGRVERLDEVVVGARPQATRPSARPRARRSA